MDVSLFDYHLPQELIAQSPAKKRDYSRLIKIDRKTGQISHHHFYEIGEMLTNNDVLVLNNTKVFPARFFGTKDTGGKIEVLLIEEVKTKIWKALSRPGIKEGQKIQFHGSVFEAIGHDHEAALLKTELDKFDLLNLLTKYGHTPLPPYIQSDQTEATIRSEYQTVYAKQKGSVAAPTAGFHFTKELIAKLIKKGVQIEQVTLHVGLGTFAPVKTKKLEDHPMHYEYFELGKETAARLNKAKAKGKRIVSVGTTTTRVLESSIDPSGELIGQKGRTNLFIYPPYKFKTTDALITNFHLPKSTLLALVSAFVSSPNTDKKFADFNTSLIGKAYNGAVKNGYRFFSFGDACFIV